MVWRNIIFAKEKLLTLNQIQMKRTALLFAMPALLLAGMLSGCQTEEPFQPEPEPPTPVEEIKVTIGTPEPSLNTVSVELTVENVAEYAYIFVKEGEEIPDAAAVMDENEVAVPDSTILKVTANGLEPETGYTFVFAARGNDPEMEPKAFTSEFKTQSYTRHLTILEKGQNHITIHVECAPEEYWKFRYYDIFEYNNWHSRVPNAMLMDGGSVYQGPKTIRLECSDKNDPVLPWVYPGTGYVILLGECDESGKLSYVPKGQGTEVPDDGLQSDEDPDGYCDWTGFFGMQNVQTEKPSDSDISTDIEIVSLTTRTALVRFTPQDGFYNFAANIIKKEDYEAMKASVGEDNMQAFLGTLGFDIAETEFEYPGLEEGEYYITCVTYADEYRTAQNFQLIPFRRKISDMAPVVLDVKGIEAPAGETANGPYYCWFNIKAPNKDARTGTFITMSEAQYINSVEYGSSALDMINGYIDQYQFTEEAVAELNSDKGVNICINAWEDTPYIIIAGALNNDDVLSYKVAKNHTLPAEAEPRSFSELFNTLNGEWTVNAVSYQNSGSTWNPYLKIKTKTRLALSPDTEDIPETIPDAVFQLYESAGIGRQVCEALVRDLKETAVKMEKKYYDRNWIVASGFELGWSEDWGQIWSSTEYYSPWMLFTSSLYRGYGNLDMYLDYGAKIFFHVDADGNLSVPCNIQENPKVLGHPGQTYLFAASETPDGNGAIQLIDKVNFPVEVSEDGNTLRIKPLEKDGKKYLFAFGEQTPNGGYKIIFTTTEDIVLTRGWNEADDKTIVEHANGNSASARMYMPGKYTGSEHITTIMPQNNHPSFWIPKKYKRVEKQPLTLDCLPGRIVE